MTKDEVLRLVDEWGFSELLIINGDSEERIEAHNALVKQVIGWIQENCSDPAPRY